MIIRACYPEYTVTSVFHHSKSGGLFRGREDRTANGLKVPFFWCSPFAGTEESGHRGHHAVAPGTLGPVELVIGLEQQLLRSYRVRCRGHRHAKAHRHGIVLAL